MIEPGRFSAVVLAGERPGGSPLSRELGLPASVFAPVAGKPSIQRVLETLAASNEVGGGVVCGPAREAVDQDARLHQWLQATGFRWVAPAAGPSDSAISAIGDLDRFPTLLTAGDHALLTAPIVDEFCRSALKMQADIVVGLAPHESVLHQFPNTKRTVQKYSDGHFCGTNLFAIMNPDGVKGLAFWREVEAHRKQPWKLARRLGPAFLSAFLLRRVSLQQALARLSELATCRVAVVPVLEGRAAVDVDTLDDLRLAEDVLLKEEGDQPHTRTR